MILLHIIKSCLDNHHHHYQLSPARELLSRFILRHVWYAVLVAIVISRPLMLSRRARIDLRASMTSCLNVISVWEMPIRIDKVHHNYAKRSIPHWSLEKGWPNSSSHQPEPSVLSAQDYCFWLEVCIYLNHLDSETWSSTPFGSNSGVDFFGVSVQKINSNPFD